MAKERVLMGVARQEGRISALTPNKPSSRRLSGIFPQPTLADFTCKHHLESSFARDKGYYGQIALSEVVLLEWFIKLRRKGRFPSQIEEKLVILRQEWRISSQFDT